LVINVPGTEEDDRFVSRRQGEEGMTGRQQEVAAAHGQEARKVAAAYLFHLRSRQTPRRRRTRNRRQGRHGQDAEQARRNGDLDRSVKARLPNPLGRFVGFPHQLAELHRPLASGLQLKLREHEIART
jgi:hypothetical protein